MNRKGFTLIELIATIALLAIIAIISFVSINGVINKSKIDNCKSLVNNIKSASKEYVSDNRYSLTSNDDLNITAKTLIDGNYLSSPITNPFDNNVPIYGIDISIRIKLADDYTVSNEENSIIIKNSSGDVVNCDSGSW